MKHFICIYCAYGNIYYKWSSSNKIFTLTQSDRKIFDVGKYGTELTLLISRESSLLLGEASLGKAPSADMLLTVDPTGNSTGGKAESVLKIDCNLNGDLQSPVMQMKFPINAQGSWSTDYSPDGRGKLTWNTRQLNITIIPSPF